MDAEVERLRWLVHSFLTSDVLANVCPGDAVLEIGPAHAGSCPVPEAFVDVQAEVVANGATYVSIDPDPAAGATVTADFLEPTAFCAGETFDHIIACEVLEHVPRIWEAPGVLRSLLKPGGTLWFSTPFFFRLHGPKPDCWRLSSDGIQALFGKHFALSIRASDDTATPLHYCVRAT